jgi:two-component system response regulator DegU
MEKINIVLADDHILVRNGIKAMLESETELNVVGEASNGREALAVARNLHPDILVLDIRMPEMTGLEAAAKLAEVSPQEYVLQALDSGAYGYLLKDTDKGEFVRALKQIHAGNKYFSGAVSNVLANRLLNHKVPFRTAPVAEDPYHLTRREREILRMVIDGKPNKQIADALGKSVRTVETHRFNIMKKMGVNNAVDMVNKAVKENLV